MKLNLCFLKMDYQPAIGKGILLFHVDYNGRHCYL